jgi:ABC-2 type transport system permease protein
MNKIFFIIFKDTVLRFTSPIELLFFIIMPLIFTFLLAGGTPSGDDDPRITLTVVDQAQTSLSASLVSQLEASTAVRPVLANLTEAEEAFDSRRINALLVIPAGFDAEALTGGTASLDLRQQPNNLNAFVASRAVQVAIQRTASAVEIARRSLAQAEDLRPFAGEADRLAYFEDARQTAEEGIAAAPARLSVVRGATPDQIEYDPAANSSAGQLITWVFIPLLGLSAMFAYERQQGTLRRLLTSPTSRAVYLFGTISGQVLTAMLQMALLVGFGIFVMQLKWGQDLAGLAVLLFSFALAASALGVALGTVVKTESQASGLSIMLGMVMALLGGCWYPLELFPEVVQNIVKILPTTWAMQGMLDLVLRGRGLAAILPEAGVLCGFALVFFVVGIWRFKYE